MFYKLENGQLKKLRLPLRLGGKDVFTNNAAILAREGYYPIEWTEYPDEEAEYTAEFEVKNDVIKQTWRLVEEDE